MWAKLTAALDGLGLAVPSAKALRDLRRRLGAAPLKALFEVLAGPLGRPRTPGVMFGRYRTVAFDGCRSIKVPDTAAEPGLAGQDERRARGDRLPGDPADDARARPAPARCSARPSAAPPTGELDWARKLLHLLDETMLVLLDRGFDAGEFLREVAATKAQFLVRLNATRRPPVLSRLPDGSFLSLIGGVKVRIITASVTVTCHDGTRYGGSYRLATTLLDHRA